MWMTCRWPNLLAINHSGIRRDCARLLGDCRLLVVLTEGGDLCPLDREILAWNLWDRETRMSCFVGYEPVCTLHCGRRLGAARGIKKQSFDELPLWKVLYGARLAVPRPGPHGTLPCKESSYLVDPASSHMLVSKIKPCMSKYKQICTVKLRMAH